MKGDSKIVSLYLTTLLDVVLTWIKDAAAYLYT